MAARSGLRLTLAAVIAATVAVLGYALWAPGVQASEAAGARPIPSISIPVVTITFAPNPVLTVTPTTLDFGSVAIGSSKQLNVTILNSSGDYLQGWNVEGGTPTLSMFSFAEGTGCTGTLPAAQTCTLVYTFRPVSTATVTSTSTFRGSSVHLPPQSFTIALTGCGLGQGISCPTTPTTTSGSPTTTTAGQGRVPLPAPGGPTAPSAIELGAGVVPSDAPSGQASAPLAATSSGPSTGLVVLLFVAALLGAVVAGLALRGRWLWSKLASRGGGPP